MTLLDALVCLLLVVGVGLSGCEVSGYPRRLQCDCGAVQLFSPRHLPSWGMFTIGISDSLYAVLLASTGRLVTARVVSGMFMFVAAYHFWRWWKHTKRTRKRLLDRALGVVKVTAAGLRIVSLHPTGTSS